MAFSQSASTVSQQATKPKAPPKAAVNVSVFKQASTLVDALGFAGLLQIATLLGASHGLSVMLGMLKCLTLSLAGTCR